MKAIVIYYSQTGNTRKIAQAIARGIEKENGQCDVERFQNITAERLLDYDLVGIGSPVWGSCPTMNIVYFIKELPDSFKNRQFFYYCTHGCSPGRAVLRAITPMTEKGLALLGWHDWYGGASLPGHLKPWFTDGHPDEQDLLEAEAFGVTMVRHSIKYSAGEHSILPKLPTPEESDYIYGIGFPFLMGAVKQGDDAPAMPPPPKADPKLAETAASFPPLKYPTTHEYAHMVEGLPNPGIIPAKPAYIDAEKCIGCNRCVEACFCENIDGSTTPPTIRNPYCEHCNFCEGVCPTGAMVADFHPPASSVEESMAFEKSGAYYGILNDAEARGHFRRLVKEEDIGWTTPWELVTTHPRHQEIP